MTWIWYGYVLSYGRFDLHPNSWPVGDWVNENKWCLAHLVQEVGQTFGFAYDLCGQYRHEFLVCRQFSPGRINSLINTVSVY